MIVDLKPKESLSLTVDDLYIYISRDCYGGILGIRVYRRFGSDKQRETPIDSISVATAQPYIGDDEED